MISKPVGVLSGHMAAVIQVVVNVNRSQLLSFSKDKVKNQMVLALCFDLSKAYCRCG